MTEIDTSILTSHHLFRSLNDAQMNSVLSSTRILNVAEGETLFHQGDKADHFYLVVSGNVKLFRSSVEGNEKIIQIVRKNQVFAEGVMFMEQAGYPVNAAIISDCQLYQFSNTRFLELLSNSHDLCLALFGDLCNRLHQMLNEVDRLSLQNARFRIIQYLDDLMQGEATKTIVLDIDKKTIASRLSITPETLSRMLRELSQQGLISMEGKKITVHDRNRLKTLA